MNVQKYAINTDITLFYHALNSDVYLNKGWYSLSSFNFLLLNVVGKSTNYIKFS